MKEHKEKIFKEVLNSVDGMSPEGKNSYRKMAGYNLGRIRDAEYLNKLPAMVAALQEGGFRESLSPENLERQIRRWIKDGLPLDNIQGIAKALNIPVTEFILITPHFCPDSHVFAQEQLDEAVSEIVNEKNAIIEQKDKIISEMVTQKQLNEAVFKAVDEKNAIIGKKDKIISDMELRRRFTMMLLKWAGIFGMVLLVCAAVFCMLPEPEAVKILWPRIVDSNFEYISGKLVNFSSDTYPEMKAKIFMNPVDGENKYWLSSDVSEITKDGYFYQKCRFGDEDLRTMIKQPPLKFDAYAVIMKKKVKLPLDPKKNYFAEKSEKDFFSKLKPYVTAISEKFVITRVKPSEPVIPIVTCVTSPVKITWSERVSMFLQIFHKGEIFKEGFYMPDELHELPSSPLLYEIKMSREKNYSRSSIWILVEHSE